MTLRVNLTWLVIVTWCKQPHAMLCQQRWRRGEWPFL